LLEDVLRHLLAKAGCYPAHPPTLDKILFVVMCATANKQRVEWMHETWLPWIPPQNLVLLSDAPIGNFNMTVLPELPADSYIRRHYPNATSYQAANLRHLASMQWLGKVHPSALDGMDWVFMVDDDTFVNPPMLLQFLQPFPPTLPLFFGHVWDNPSWLPSNGGKKLAYTSGGGGMLMSKAAYLRFAALLFTAECGVVDALNDITFGTCSPAAGVVKIHSTKFKPEREAATYAPFLYDVGQWVTRHRATSREQLLAFTCIVAKRYGLAHRLCGDIVVVCDPACHMSHGETLLT
jgi:hypothetical protein